VDFSSNTALITGSSGGIGKEFAVQLAQRGVNLVLVARRADKLEELRKTLFERHPDIVIDVITADLATPGSGAQLATKVRDLGRPIDILVNNAGVGLHAKFVGQDPDAQAGGRHRHGRARQVHSDNRFRLAKRLAVDWIPVHPPQSDGPDFRTAAEGQLTYAREIRTTPFVPA
jgi:NAD(P)-dependent dehydrogenase (short-subunit alcohol dehydrogenase family)